MVLHLERHGCRSLRRQQQQQSASSSSNISGDGAATAAAPTAMLPRRATWTRNRLEHAAAALLARVGHSITPAAPPPGGPLYLREPDARTPLGAVRAARGCCRARCRIASSVAWSSATLTEYEAAANADAAEPAPRLRPERLASPHTRPRHAMVVTRLMAAEQVCRTSASTFASAAAASPLPDVRARRARAVASGGLHQRASALQPLEPSDAEVEVRAWRGAALMCPVRRHGHSRTLRGGVGSLPASWCAASRHGGHASGSSSGLSSGSGSGSGGGEVGGEVGEGAGGCLLVYGGADAASSPLDDLWVLRVDPRWALPRDEFEARPQLTWRALVPASSGALPPPRAFHASVQARETLSSSAARRRGSRAAPAPRYVRSQGLVWSVALGLAARDSRFTCPRCGGRS